MITGASLGRCGGSRRRYGRALSLAALAEIEQAEVTVQSLGLIVRSPGRSVRSQLRRPRRRRPLSPSGRRRSRAASRVTSRPIRVAWRVRLRKLDLRQPHTYEAAGAEAVLVR